MVTQPVEIGGTRVCAANNGTHHLGGGGGGGGGERGGALIVHDVIQLEHAYCFCLPVPRPSHMQLIMVCSSN